MRTLFIISFVLASILSNAQNSYLHCDQDTIWYEECHDKQGNLKNDITIWSFCKELELPQKKGESIKILNQNQNTIFVITKISEKRYVINLHIINDTMKKKGSKILEYLFFTIVEHHKVIFDYRNTKVTQFE